MNKWNIYSQREHDHEVIEKRSWKPEEHCYVMLWLL